jgi:CelD/BcsL family acetyltransferase involved in cellulose biosynthesis
MTHSTTREEAGAPGPARDARDLVHEGGDGDKLRIVTLPGGQGLAAHRPAWQALAADACEPNVFYEPFLLEPALRELRGDAPVDVVLVYDDGAGRSERLRGLFPVVARSASRRLPLRSLALWKHPHCFLCTPLVRRDGAAATLEAFFAWLARGPRAAPWMAFEHVSADGPFAALLADHLASRGQGRLEIERFERAVIRTGESADAYLREAMPRKRRHEVERQQRRLAEHGALAFRALEPDAPAAELERWIGAFLDLEAAGWKGRAASAISARPAERRFFEAAARAAHGAGRLGLLALEQAGRPVAMKCNFWTDAAQGGGFAFKIAFDESLSRFSPGVLLEFEQVRRLHADPDRRWMDSCANAGHPMIERIWRQRRAIGDWLVPTGRRGGEAARVLYGWLRTAKRGLSGTLETLRTTTPRAEREEA